MASLVLGDYVTAPTTGPLGATAYGSLDTYELADFLARWPELHRQALDALGEAGRIHPTAFIHPQAIIGDDVIVGPGAKVYEFSAIRKGSILCAGASVGFNCEVTAAFIGEGAVLGHRIGINRTVVGADAHLSAGVTVAAINMSDDMRAPDREVIIRTHDGIYRCGTPQFGALIGDGTQTGNSISLGPGVAIGRHVRINSGVTLAIRSIPDYSVVTAPHTAEAEVRSRRGPVGQAPFTTAGAAGAGRPSSWL
ncbi:transferase [Streptomyces sp. NBC_00162]|uniref:transferase n=1 Tax=Streptomyces sp. NBC_00162 TaxID=2903629 RepID=UPI00214B5C4A|nr:transferase [Streptomyces sp. NBC_00162]UUU45013.1 transferase [Streptomyces sp. NBC_00162]